MKKALSYILSVIGIIIVAIGTIKPLRASLSFIPSSINDIIITLVGVVIVIVAIFLMYNKSQDKVSEVPIYHGKDVVGFRRIGKK